MAFGLPENIPVYEMGPDMHTHIDPVEEARAMKGDQDVIVIETPDDKDKERLIRREEL